MVETKKKKKRFTNVQLLFESLYLVYYVTCLIRRGTQMIVHKQNTITKSHYERNTKNKYLHNYIPKNLYPMRRHNRDFCGYQKI